VEYHIAFVRGRAISEVPIGWNIAVDFSAENVSPKAPGLWTAVLPDVPG
jgi:hypothetical protein